VAALASGTLPPSWHVPLVHVVDVLDVRRELREELAEPAGPHTAEVGPERS
jgi:hypothetical protein